MKKHFTMFTQSLSSFQTLNATADKHQDFVHHCTLNITKKLLTVSDTMDQNIQSVKREKLNKLHNLNVN